MKKLIIIWMMAICLIVFGKEAWAQASGCYDPTIFYVASLCCGSPVARYNNGGDTYIGYKYTVCCSRGTIVPAAGGYCLQANLKRPNVIDKLMQSDSEGRMLIATCNGKLVPLQALKERSLPEPSLLLRSRDLEIDKSILTGGL